MICACRTDAHSGKGCAPEGVKPNDCGVGSWLARRPELRAPLRHFASGGQRAAPERHDQLAQRTENALVSLAEQRREDVLADLVAPEMIAAVAARHLGGVQVDPVSLGAAGDAV